jgi:hypothetical protein
MADKHAKFEILALPGDLIVNRIPETEIGYNLGYKLAAGKVIKSGIPVVKDGDLIIFGLQDAKEWDFPLGMDIGFELSSLGVFQLREGDLRAQIIKMHEGEPTTILGS